MQRIKLLASALAAFTFQALLTPDNTEASDKYSESPPTTSIVTERVMAAAMAKNLSPVRLVARSSLHVSKPTWWLESRFHFSFADYFDSSRMNFGALRVINDDLVQGKAGFGAHPHRDAEIFSYVVDGQLTHQDSMGNLESLSRGAVQYLSAGKGIVHSEMNKHSKTCRFLQVWITPDRSGHEPQYGSATFERKDRHNRLLHLLGGTAEAPKWDNVNGPSSIHLHQDANVYVSEADAGTTFELALGQRRQAYLVCIEGAMDVNGQRMDMRDGMQVLGSNGEATKLVISAQQPDGAHFMLIEMARAGLV